VKVWSFSCTQIVRVILKDELIPLMKIEEVFLVNVDELVEEFGKLLDVTKPASGSQSEEDESKLVVLQDPEYRRLKSRVDLGLALRLYNRKW
jgi:glycogen debranching enzyme